MKTLSMVIIGVLLAVTCASADQLVVQMNLIDRDGVGRPTGIITLLMGPHGTLFRPDLSGLTPGLHGFHVHQNPDCGPGVKQGVKVPGLAAGGHYDPAHRGSHQGPYADGHLGDLPALFVGVDGRATLPVLAPRLKLEDVKGRSLMIHAWGDNYSDHPKKLGGGGTRVACGVVR